jgi:hypothetical protein
VPAIRSMLESAIREGGFTAKNIPSVAVHLTNGAASSTELAADVIKLDKKLIEQIESFLGQSGIPLEDGLKTLKADAASDAIIMTANGLEGSKQEVVIKIARQKGIFDYHPHIKDDWYANAIQTTFDSAAWPAQSIMVRIEPKMLPVDKAIEQLPVEMRQQATLDFNNAMYAKAKAKGLAARDVKPNNFGIPLDSGLITSVADILAHDPKVMDMDAMVIPPKGMAAIDYTPQIDPAPPKHIHELFHTPDKAVEGPKSMGTWVEKVTDTALPSLEKAVALKERMERLGLRQNTSAINKQ